MGEPKIKHTNIARDRKRMSAIVQAFAKAMVQKISIVDNLNLEDVTDSATALAGLEVRITDTGKGIPPEIKDRIFDAFFTTKAAGEGSGLGLYIVKQIIDKHKGRIWFESQVGKGTTVFVELSVLQ